MRYHDLGVGHLTRIGCVYQPAHLQAGAPSNPQKPANAPPRVPHQHISVVQLGPSPDDIMQQQLERIQAPISSWGLIASSKAHRQKLQQALSRLEIPANVTPEEFVGLILLVPSKHSVTFTERDLTVEGFNHNPPLHIISSARDFGFPLS